MLGQILWYHNCKNGAIISPFERVALAKSFFLSLSLPSENILSPHPTHNNKSVCNIMDNKDTRNIGTARESSVYEADPHHAQTETLVEHSVTQLQVVDDDVVHRTPHSQRSSQDRAFHWSVKIVPPDEAIMSRHVFGDIIYSSIKGMLASDSAGNQFSWPDRGWRNEGEFRSEWRAAMRTEHGHVHVSRAQTFEEATQLKTDLASLQIQAEVEQVGISIQLCVNILMIIA